MNVTLNTVNFNNNYKYQNNRKVTPSFTSAVELPAKSGLLNPFKNGMDKLSEIIAKYYTKTVYESPVAKWLSRNEDASQIVNHMQMIGSVIVSGMYMTQTLRNKNMDEETKKKLSINQALTWVAATLGAYGLDAALDNVWDKHINLKYAAKFLSNNKEEKLEKYQTLLKDFEELNKTKKAEHNANPKNHARTLLSPFGKKFKPVSASKYIADTIKNGTLTNDLKGLDVMKSLVIFGTIYRFISPVAVTPLANIIGDKIFSKKEDDIVPQSPTIMLNRPEMAHFAGGFDKNA